MEGEFNVKVRLGFTIIELLVVIAIIAALAGILFPVLSAAKRASFKSTAISNAKQLAMASSMYSTDADNVLCPYFSGYDTLAHIYTSPQKYWPELVSVYISPTQGHGNLGQALADDLPKVFFDPIKPFRSQALSTFKFGIISSWGVSDDLVDWFAPDGVKPSKRPATESEISNPPECIHLVETRDWQLEEGFPGNAISLSYFDRSGTGALVSLDAPHDTSRGADKTGSADPKGRNVVAFADGHVRAIVASTILFSGKYWSRSGNNNWP